MLKFFRPQNTADERWLRRRRIALWCFGLASPFLFAGSYVLLLLAAQSDHREPLWAEDTELKGVRWIPNPPRTLEVTVRFYRKDGRAGKYPQVMWLQTLDGLRYRLEGDPKITMNTHGNEATMILKHTLNEKVPRIKHKVVSLVAEHRESPPPDPFASLRWLPGMPHAPSGPGRHFEIVPRLSLPQEPKS